VLFLSPSPSLIIITIIIIMKTSCEYTVFGFVTLTRDVARGTRSTRSSSQSLVPYSSTQQQQQQIVQASKDNDKEGSFALFALNTNDIENENDSNEDQPTLSVGGTRTCTSARTRWRRRVKKFGKTLLLSSAFYAASYSGLGPRSSAGGTAGGVPPAEAKYSYEIRDDKKFSLRPGVTQEQATQMVEGTVPDDYVPDGKSVFDETAAAVQDRKEAQARTKQSKNSFDYGDDDENDGAVNEDDAFLSEYSDKDQVNLAPSSRKSSILKSQQAISDRLTSSTRDQFTGIDTAKTKTRSMTVKVSVALFIPTWGAMGAREFFRRRREEVYVKTGLEIMKVQKAEYFNATKTDDDDDDDEDDANTTQTTLGK
jgi:hypothetical protein